MTSILDASQIEADLPAHLLFRPVVEDPVLSALLVDQLIAQTNQYWFVVFVSPSLRDATVG